MARTNVHESLHLTGAVSGATNASPIVITTSSAHNLVTGNTVTIDGVKGNLAANGTFTVTVVSSTTFSIGVAGTGDYTGGGQFRAKFSGARTATVSTAPATSPDALAMHVLVNVSAVDATPSMTPKIEGYDLTSGTWYTVLEGVAMTATGIQVLKVGLSIAPSANAAAQDLVPLTWRVTCTHADSDSITYTLAYNMTNK